MVNATLKNMKKYQATLGLLAVSPYTGEEYSANIGDYFWAPRAFNLKDSTGRVMKLARKFLYKKHPHSKIETRIELL